MSIEEAMILEGKERKGNCKCEEKRVLGRMEEEAMWEEKGREVEKVKSEMKERK